MLCDAARLTRGRDRGSRSLLLPRLPRAADRGYEVTFARSAKTLASSAAAPASIRHRALWPCQHRVAKVESGDKTIFSKDLNAVIAWCDKLGSLFHIRGCTEFGADRREARSTSTLRLVSPTWPTADAAVDKATQQLQKSTTAPVFPVKSGSSNLGRSGLVIGGCSSQATLPIRLQSLDRKDRCSICSTCQIGSRCGGDCNGLDYLASGCSGFCKHYVRFRQCRQ